VRALPAHVADKTTRRFVTPANPEQPTPVFIHAVDWSTIPRADDYLPARPRPAVRSLLLAATLFLLTLCTSVLAGTHFAIAYAHNQAASLDALIGTFTLIYRHPTALFAGLPFALTLLAILLAHELGHLFACRYHHIRASYPFFIPAPTLIGTFGAFILIRSPIRTARALFDVGASGPFAGFALAVPALLCGVLYAKVVPDLTNSQNADVIFGIPILMRLLAAVFHPGVHVSQLLLHPVGRAAWVGLLATALNLLPVGQLDGGHILRSLSPRGHRASSFLLPLCLVPLGFLFWHGWFIWAGLLFGLRFFRSIPIYDPTPLDPSRRFAAVLALIVFVLCFMSYPLKPV
jgi:membrane-associated protease RseP (regulator of RpoE activity)